MADDLDENEDASSLLCGEGRAELDSILNTDISLDVLVNDFLLIAGWSFRGSQIYENADENIQGYLLYYLRQRSEELSREEGALEARFSNTICSSKFGRRPLADYKKFVEICGATGLRNIGIKSYARFSQELKNRGIEPFKVADPISAERLTQYGLEKGEKPKDSVKRKYLRSIF